MGITVYMPPEMKSEYPQYNAVGLEEKKRIRNGDFELTPLYVPHNGTPNYAYIIRCAGHTISWLTDLEYCPYLLKSQNLTEIFCECNYQNNLVDRDLPQYTHKLMGHMSLDCCRDFIAANKTNALRTVILCHMGTETAIEEECVAEVQEVAGNANVSVAKAGESWELSLYPF